MVETGTSIDIPSEVSSNLEVSTSVQEHQETLKNQNPLLIFGQGPVVDLEARIKAQDAGSHVGSEDISLWSQNIAKAGAILFKKGIAPEIIIMGGPTGGEAYQAEADLIANHLVALGVPESVIKKETGSTNTLENLVNVLNEQLDQDGFNFKKVNVLGAPYHVPRMKLLMELFGMQYDYSFSSDEVLRAVAREGEPEKWDNDALLEIEQRNDFNAAGRVPVSEKDAQIKVGYFDQQKGTEQKTVLRRAFEEDVWTRALLEMPEYWLVYGAKIKDHTRLHNFITNAEELFPGVLENKGISETATDDIIRERLSLVTREMPNVEDWIVEQKQRPKGLPEKTSDTLNRVIDRRNKRKAA